MFLSSRSDEDCEGGSLIVSYSASEGDVPTEFGDQVAAIECLLFLSNRVLWF